FFDLWYFYQNLNGVARSPNMWVGLKIFLGGGWVGGVGWGGGGVLTPINSPPSRKKIALTIKIELTFPLKALLN
ncbi:MAG: hypothetical protein ACK552_17170, partial [Microcystis sp.]